MHLLISSTLTGKGQKAIPDATACETQPLRPLASIHFSISATADKDYSFDAPLRTLYRKKVNWLFLQPDTWGRPDFQIDTCRP
jgi:hypothetical protein